MPHPEEQNNQYVVDSNSQNGLLGFLKHALVFIVLAFLIVGSFWLSYVMGKMILLPVKQPPKPRVEIAIPETPPSIAHLQKLEEKIKQQEEMTPSTTVTIPAKQVVERKVSSQVGRFYRVQAGFFENRTNADNLSDALRKQGFPTYQNQTGRGTRVLLGTFNARAEAQSLKDKLISKGFEAIVIYE